MDIEAIVKNPTVKKVLWGIFGVGVAIFVIRVFMQVMFFSQMTNFIFGQRDRMEAFHHDMREEARLIDREIERGIERMHAKADQMQQEMSAFQKEFTESSRKAADQFQRTSQEDELKKQ